MALYEIMETNEGSVAIVEADSEEVIREAFKHYLKERSTPNPSGLGFATWISNGGSPLVKRRTFREIWIDADHRLYIGS